MTDPKSRALVTGATGFIGARLAERLIGDGRPVRLLVRNPQRLAPSLRDACEVVVGDLLDRAAVGRAVADAGVIFHCAANVRTWDSRKSYYAANVSGVKTLLDAIAGENPRLSRLVHLSTVDVYGFPPSPCDEQCPTTGAGFGYGETKLLGEALVREYRERAGISAVIIRPANVIGPGSPFIARIGRALKSGVMLTVDGGRANAGLVYVDNLIDRLLWAAAAQKAAGECYNVRDDYDATWAAFLERFRFSIGGRGKILDLSFPVADAIAMGFEAIHRIVAPAREPVLHRLLVRIFGRTCGHSARKIRDHSGRAATIGFEEAMEKSCRWFLESGGPR